MTKPNQTSADVTRIIAKLRKQGGDTCETAAAKLAELDAAVNSTADENARLTRRLTKVREANAKLAEE